MKEKFIGDFRRDPVVLVIKLHPLTITAAFYPKNKGKEWYVYDYTGPSGYLHRAPIVGKNTAKEVLEKVRRRS